MMIAASTPCILVAEDEMLLVMMLEDHLESLGYHVLKASRLHRGLELAQSESIDVALIDINLAGEESFPIAAVLRRRGIRFVFSSGYGSDGLPADWRDEKMLQKPYNLKQLTAALEVLREG